MAKKRDSSSSETGTDAKPVNFEKSLQELESLVERMESGEQPLEQSLKDFERGIALTRACQQALSAAEQKVKILMAKHGQSGESDPLAGGAADDADLTDFDSDSAPPA